MDALNLLLKDVYTDKQIVKDGVIPEDFVFSFSGYLPECEGMVPPKGIYSHISGIDLVQAKDKSWYILEDNLRIPSGASYPLIARELCRRASPQTYQSNRIIDNRNYHKLLRDTMENVNCGGIPVIMTPGRYNAAYFEQSYRDELRVTGYRFGSGEKAACIVGAIRGNEIQQLYVCSQLIKALKELEERKAIVSNHEILGIPSVNQYSMNIEKRFWAVDNTDINRMFPGYDLGETTQRIAAGVFEKAKGYSYGIQFASFYMPGDFVPHVRMMETGYQNASLANLFGLRYVVIRKPRPIDTTTLNYNWQLWDTNAFSVYTKETDNIDEQSARIAVSAVLRFLTRMGILHYNCHSGYITSVFYENELTTVHASEAGILRRYRFPGEEVRRGDLLAEILDPYEGTAKVQVLAPTDGIIFFSHKKPLVIQKDIICRIIRRLHE